MTLKDKAKTIIIGYCVMLIWTMFFTSFITVVKSAQFMFNQPTALYMFVRTCIMAPLAEELIFRKGVLDIFKDSKHIIPVVILSSVVFGMLHNNAYNLWIQGVFGLIFSWVYIKNGYCYWSSVILHSMWNLTCLLVMMFR